MRKIKVGDIYYSRSWGAGCVSFFQIISLRGKTQVVVREIDKKIIKEGLENDAYGSLVVPVVNSFLKESSDLGNDVYTKSDNKGKIKKLDENNLIDIRFSSVYIWDKKPVEDHLYYY